MIKICKIDVKYHSTIDIIQPILDTVEIPAHYLRLHLPENRGELDTSYLKKSNLSYFTVMITQGHKYNIYETVRHFTHPIDIINGFSEEQQARQKTHHSVG